MGLRCLSDGGCPVPNGNQGLKVLVSLSSREWRNWQTRWLQVPVLERAWGFKSPLAHADWIPELLGSAGTIRTNGKDPRLHAGGLFGLTVCPSVKQPAGVC